MLLLIKIDSKHTAIINKERDLNEANPQSADFTIGRIKQLRPIIVKTDPILSILNGLLVSSNLLSV